jgi:hypothetical protein
VAFLIGALTLLSQKLATSPPQFQSILVFLFCRPGKSCPIFSNENRAKKRLPLDRRSQGEA